MTKQEQENFLSIISKGQIKKAIEGLMKLDFENAEKKILTGIAAQYQHWQQNKLKGILSAEQDNLQQNQITNRLIEFISHSEEPSLTVTAANHPSIKKSFWKSNGIKLLGVIGSLASIIALWFVFFPPTNSPTTKSVTVLVHGKEGKDHLILPNRGKVYLIYGDAKIPEQINNEGEATFKQIPNKFFTPNAKVEIIFEDPKGESYRVANPDSLYDLKDNSYIALEVILKGTEQISGIIKDFETGDPIDSVMVRVFGKETYSNKYGEFVLNIPEGQRQKFITLRAYKKGYHRWEKENLPTTTNNKIIIPLKIE